MIEFWKEEEEKGKVFDWFYENRFHKSMDDDDQCFRNRNDNSGWI